jgi:hypothetical protein
MIDDNIDTISRKKYNIVNISFVIYLYSFLIILLNIIGIIIFYFYKNLLIDYLSIYIFIQIPLIINNIVLNYIEKMLLEDKS